MILPEKLEEADTDFSSILPFNGHAETVQKILDVVKKSTNGIDLVILGLENQQHIHYGMPLRIMLGDAMGYLKEYQEIAKRNRAAGSLEGSEEYLSGFHREDRLHPMITICLYYGGARMGRTVFSNGYAENTQRIPQCSERLFHEFGTGKGERKVFLPK